MNEITTFNKFRYKISKYSILIAIFIATLFEILRFFAFFPPSKLIVETTLGLIFILWILYYILIKTNIKLLYIQLITFLCVINYIIFQTTLVEYHKFLPIWIDFSLIIAFIIMDKKYAVFLSVYSFLGILSIYLLNKYSIDFFSLFTLLFSIVSFSMIGYIIATQFEKYEKENIQQQQKLNQLILVDELTQIFNRRAFFDISKKILQQANRENKNIAVLMLDIDFFKQINDTYGHDAGDFVLVNIANIIKKSIRNSDVFARIGGDEFSIVLYDINEKQINIVIRKILSNIRKAKIKYKNDVINISMSIGAYYETKDMFKNDITNLLLKADEALYKSKHSGRNTFTLLKDI